MIRIKRKTRTVYRRSSDTRTPVKGDWVVMEQDVYRIPKGTILEVIRGVDPSGCIKVDTSAVRTRGSEDCTLYLERVTLLELVK